MRYYILSDDGQTPIPEPDFKKWGEWMEASQRRRVALTKVGEEEVSTVFLGMDHSFDPLRKADPVLWETMVFDNPGCTRELDMDRCSGTRADAETMHQRMVEKWTQKNR